MGDRSNRNPRSLANSELFRDGSVAFGVLLAQVLEQTPALADEHQETAAGVVVLLVGLELVGEALLLVRRQPHAEILPGVPPPIATSPGPACGSVGTGS